LNKVYELLHSDNNKGKSTYDHNIKYLWATIIKDTKTKIFGIEEVSEILTKVTENVLNEVRVENFQDLGKEMDI
jgi:hypothetical protein